MFQLDLKKDDISLSGAEILQILQIKFMDISFHPYCSVGILEVNKLSFFLVFQSYFPGPAVCV